MSFLKKHTLYFIICFTVILSGCENSDSSENSAPSNRTAALTVTATAYNAVEHQTKRGNPSLAAWGDILKPGIRAVAVSRDLIALGLDYNEKIEIEGLKGIYVVKDKMNRRWKRKIDIFMGLDEEAAREWGKREVTIFYNPKDRPGDRFSRNGLGKNQ